MFGIGQKKTETPTEGKEGFSYLPEGVHYFDSACQTLRPMEVIQAVEGYYKTYNACGERVKYPWGERVDKEVEETREAMLRYVGKKAEDYVVCFTHNTTYGINLVLSQLAGDKFDTVVTSDIEHNSAYLPTMSFAERTGVKRVVLEREEDGSIMPNWKELGRSIWLVNGASNINGVRLANREELAEGIHEQGGLLLVDAAQVLGHHPEDLRDLDFDACFGSVHKMYGPSMGVIVIRKTLLKQLRIGILGGGMVGDVYKDTYSLLEGDEHLHSRLEMGLQSWEGIIGLRAALKWQDSYKIQGKPYKEYTQELEEYTFNELKAMQGVHLVGEAPGSSIAFYHEGIDSHSLGLMLAKAGVYARSGYFCCHYYLKNKKELPPLLRLSFGAHLRQKDVDHALDSIAHIFSTLA